MALDAIFLLIRSRSDIESTLEVDLRRWPVG